MAKPAAVPGGPALDVSDMQIEGSSKSAATLSPATDQKKSKCDVDSLKARVAARPWMDPHRSFTTALDAIQAAAKLGTTKLKCGMCGWLEDGPKLFSGVFWCSGCLDKLLQCPKCHDTKGYYYDPTSLYRLPDGERMDPPRHVYHGCVKCGFKRMFALCSKCNYLQENGDNRDGVYTCWSCK